MLFLEFLALHLLLFLSLETIQAGAFSGEDKILMEMLSKANNCFTYRPNKDRGEKIKIPEEKIKLFGTKEQKIAKESVFEDMSKNGQLKQLKGENSTLRRRQVVVLPKKQFFTPPLTKDNQETNQPNSKISSGICGDYDGDNEIGVCLWSGNNFFGGWINGEMDHICNKEIMLKKKDGLEVKARVLDGCKFDILNVSLGCSQLFLTPKAFKSLNATKEDFDMGYLSVQLMWNFAL